MTLVFDAFEVLEMTVVSVLALLLPLLGMLPLASRSNTKSVNFVGITIFMYHKSFNLKENYKSDMALILWK